MDSIQDLVIPIAVALISVIVTAIVTIQIKYASTKEEAYSGLKSVAASALYYLWTAFLIFILIQQLIANDPPTRADVFRISVITTSLFLLIVLRLIKGITAIVRSHGDLHHKHINLLENHIKTCHPEMIREKSPKSSGPGNLGSK